MFHTTRNEPKLYAPTFSTKLCAHAFYRVGREGCFYWQHDWLLPLHELWRANQSFQSSSAVWEKSNIKCLMMICFTKRCLNINRFSEKKKNFSSSYRLTQRYKATSEVTLPGDKATPVPSTLSHTKIDIFLPASLSLLFPFSGWLYLLLHWTWTSYDTEDQCRSTEV